MMRRLVFSALALLALSGCKTSGINPLKIEVPDDRALVVQFLGSVLDRLR